MGFLVGLTASFGMTKYLFEENKKHPPKLDLILSGQFL